MSTFVASPRSSAEGSGLRYEGQEYWFRSQTYNLIPAFPLAIGGILINFVYSESGFLICNMGMITESVPETVARPREGARCLAQGLAHSRCAINSLLEMLFPPQPEFFVAGGNFLCLSPDQKPGPFTANRRCVCHPCPCPRLSACPAPSLSPQPLALLTWGSWPPVVSRPPSPPPHGHILLPKALGPASLAGLPCVLPGTPCSPFARLTLCRQLRSSPLCKL